MIGSAIFQENKKKLIKANLKNKIFMLSLAFFIPFFLMLIVFIINKIHPFGYNSILISDCGGQYADFLAYFKTIFTENNNLLYTFSKTLGGDMISLFAYYLGSPLNFILFLFSSENLPIAILTIVLIKIGLCGLTFNIFLNKIYSPRPVNLLFSTAYALCGYNMVYFWNIMWIDSVILLPLIILGIDKMIENNKINYIYIFSLSAALLINYYTGYMVCIFGGIYFVYKLLLKIDNFKALVLYKDRVLKYILSSILSVGLSFFMLLPILLSLGGTKANFSSTSFSLSENFKFMDILSKLYTNSWDSGQVFSNGVPNIFTGMLVVTLAVLYFLNAKTQLKEKFLSAGVLLVLFMSFHIEAFDHIWHGFNAPAGFPYRNSFVCSFFLICLAYKSLVNIKNLSRNNFICAALIFFTTSIILFRNHYEFVSIKFVYFDVFIVLCLCSLLYLANTQGNKKIFEIFISIISLLSLFVNATFIVRKIKYYNYKTTKSYVNHVKDVKPVIDTIKENDKSFYRIEKMFNRTLNDSMQFSYNGLSHFSSCEKAFVKSFMGKMGFRNNKIWAYYNEGSTILADSLLGVKYLLADDIIKKPYNLLFTKNDIDVYTNPYALPVGFIASNKILDVKLDKKEKNVFKIQNDILKSMLNEDLKELFTSAQIEEIVLENLKIKTNNNTKISDKNQIKDQDGDLNKIPNINQDGDKIKNQNRNIDGDMDNDRNRDQDGNKKKKGNRNRIQDGDQNKDQDNNLDENLNKKKVKKPYITYKKIDKDDDAFISYKVKITNSNRLYAYFDAPELQEETEIFINNIPLGRYFNTYRWDAVLLGRFDIGDIIEFKIKVNDSVLKIRDVYFYYEDIDVIQKSFEELSADFCSFEKISSSRLRGSVYSSKENGYLLFTIPYESGWKIKVDGKDSKSVMIFDALMAVPISQGEHIVELNYTPRGLYAGMTISLLFLLVTVAYFILEKYKIYKVRINSKK